MSTEARSARELTRSLTAGLLGSGTPTERDLLAILVVCERACSDLARSLGTPGFIALLRRAKTTAESTHPVLGDVSLASREPFFGGVPALLQHHDAGAVINSLEAVLDAVFSVLGGLIGHDMVIRLVEHGPTVESTLVEDAR